MKDQLLPEICPGFVQKVETAKGRIQQLEQKPGFSMFGYTGSGKSTILNELLFGGPNGGYLTRDRDFSGCSGRGFGSLNN